MEQLIENQVLQAAKAVEEQLDAEINRLDKMDDDELEKLRERRIQAMKKAQSQRQVITHIVRTGKGIICGIFSGMDEQRTRRLERAAVRERFFRRMQRK